MFSIFYRSQRVGRGGKIFTMYKLRTLKEGADKNTFAEQYTFLGRFLRKTKTDELPQLWNVIKRDINLVGPRAEEERSLSVIPKETRDILLSVRPGLTSLSSIHFFDEEAILRDAKDKHKVYWTFIKPTKILLDTFYIEHKCFALDLVIIWLTLKKVIKSFF